MTSIYASFYIQNTVNIHHLYSKVSLGLFIVTLNVCSAQIWSNTCRKISPVKYEDVMLWEDKVGELVTRSNIAHNSNRKYLK